MRFLHTSDWHLGRDLGKHSLAEGQERALTQIVDEAIKHSVDAVVIAGDVFDRANPSPADVRRLNAALTRIHEAGIPIIMTAGNHDEGSKLAAYNNLLQKNVHVIGEYHQVVTAVELKDDHGPVIFYPLPYLNPDVARRELATEPGNWLGRSHEAVMSEAMRRVKEDLSVRKKKNAATRAVVVSHAFVVTGKESPAEIDAETCQSERDIKVGGVPSVPSAVFQGIDYVALGHLHRPHFVGDPATAPTIRYSGSLLRYSISETKHEKSISLVDIDKDGSCTVTPIAITQPAGMARLSDDLASLCSGKYAQHADDFVEIEITDPRPPDNFFAMLSLHFSKILSVNIVKLGPESGSNAKIEIHGVAPIETLYNFYQVMTSEEANENQKQILQDVLERALASVPESEL